MEITAADIIGSPALYNLSWRIGRGRVQWECTGANNQRTKVRFARLVSDDDGIRQITCYVNPDQQMYTDADTSEWKSDK